MRRAFKSLWCSCSPQITKFSQCNQSENASQMISSCLDQCASCTWRHAWLGISVAPAVSTRMFVFRVCCLQGIRRGGSEIGAEKVDPLFRWRQCHHFHNVHVGVRSDHTRRQHNCKQALFPTSSTCTYCTRPRAILMQAPSSPQSPLLFVMVGHRGKLSNS